MELIVCNLWMDTLSSDSLRVVHSPTPPQLPQESRTTLIVMERSRLGHIPLLVSFFRQATDNAQPEVLDGTYAMQRCLSDLRIYRMRLMLVLSRSPLSTRRKSGVKRPTSVMTRDFLLSRVPIFWFIPLKKAVKGKKLMKKRPRLLMS